MSEAPARISAVQFREHQLGNTVSHRISDVHVPTGAPRVNPGMASTFSSAPLLFHSKEVNQGEGHVASVSKSNRGTLYETGF